MLSLTRVRPKAKPRNLDTRPGPRENVDFDWPYRTPPTREVYLICLLAGPPTVGPQGPQPYTPEVVVINRASDSIQITLMFPAT